MAKIIEFAATGRRKTAAARARLISGLGDVKVNGLEIGAYFCSDILRDQALAPLREVDALKLFDVKISVKGGGKSGQAGACSHAIARALVNSDETLRAPLKSAGFLTRDPRAKERNKPGQPGARKRFQFSKR